MQKLNIFTKTVGSHLQLPIFKNELMTLELFVLYSSTNGTSPFSKNKNKNTSVFKKENLLGG